MDEEESIPASLFAYLSRPRVLFALFFGIVLLVVLLWITASLHESVPTPIIGVMILMMLLSLAVEAMKKEE